MRVTSQASGFSGDYQYFWLQKQRGPNLCGFKHQKNLSSFNPWEKKEPDLLLLTPAIFGGAAFFILGVSFHGRNLTTGYNKFIFFMNIAALISTFGVGAYIINIFQFRPKEAYLNDIILPLVVMVLYFASSFNLIYSLYPSAYSGTIGKTRAAQFLTFLAMSIGSISVGEQYDVTFNNPGVQILTAIENGFNLIILTLLVAFVV
ncbi:MAG: hypothetical protein ACOX7U_01385 [Desulfitobacteriia bacterium]|jgi:hypothetical protein